MKVQCSSKPSELILQRGFPLPLTLQPFSPKLRLTSYMPSKRSSVVFVALLLGFLFLGAQLHFCVDFAPDPTGSHLCPICSAAASAALTAGPAVSIVPVLQALEIPSLAQFSPASFSLHISSRAPPAR